MSNLLALIGRWVFDRQIEDRRAGVTHHITGVADFVQTEGQRIQWSESGTWHGVGPVSRRLVIDRGDVYFEDGRFFHPFVCDEWVVHPCVDDEYRGRLQWHDDALVITWQVTGPEKEHDITTVYTKDDTTAYSKDLS